MDAGINQLVDTYKGNPAPLQQQVQRDQKQQPPGTLPPDLEAAIALQKIAELRTSAQNQQAMQTGGAQPSVVDKLRQMLGGMQQQAQPQMPQRPMMPQQPVRAATGGSIAQLVSNLGHNYAGGGIIAFSGKDGSKVDDSDNRSWIEKLLYSNLSPAEQQRRAALAAAAESARVNPTSANEERDRNMAIVNRPEPNMTQEVLERTGLATRQEQPTQQVIGQPAPTVAPAPAPAAPPVQKPAVSQGIATPKVDPNSLRALSEKYIRDEMGINPESERDKAVEWSRKTMGLDDLLAEKAKRADAREQAIAEAKANRTPEWIKGLQAASGAPVRGGIGMLLGKMGAAATDTREAYAAQDLAYQAELDRLRDVITDAKVKGNMELAKEGMAAYKEVDARRKAALTSATSLLNTDEQAATRLQIAREGAANRAVAQQGAVDQRKMANAINAVKNDEVINRLQKRAEELSKSFAAKDRAEAEGVLKKIDDRQNAIYKQFGVLEGLSTMGTAPGAGSPGGTSLKYNPKTGKIE